MSALLQREPVVMTTGLLQPALGDIITFNGAPVDMDGASGVFFMRPMLSRTPIINGTATPLSPPDPATGNNIVYQWQAGDTAIEGEYMGWWGYELSGSTLVETPEFPIVITDHGPGFGVSTGVIVDGVSAWMPTTLNGLRNEPNFGDRMLQQHADYVKQIILGQVVPPDQEAQYNPVLIEYLSKRTALRLITPAKDYWGRQYTQVSAGGPTEHASYPNMLANLDVLEQRLHRELISDWRQLQFIVPGLPQLRVEPRPMSSLGDPSPFNRQRTPDPNITPPPRLGGPWQDGWFMP